MHSISQWRNVAVVRVPLSLRMASPVRSRSLARIAAREFAPKCASACCLGGQLQFQGGREGVAGGMVDCFSPRARSEGVTAVTSSAIVQVETMPDSDVTFAVGCRDSPSPFLLAPEDRPVRKKVTPGPGYGQTKLGRPTTGELEVGGFSIEGVSVGGQETCVMLPALKIAFDSGRCPGRIIDMDYVFITHAHMDHIGGLAMYIASRGLKKKKVPTVIVPKCIKAIVEKLLAVQRELDESPLPVNLIGMDIGEEFDLGKGLIIKAFKTYHVVPSQGYIIYTVKQKLKAEHVGLLGKEIKALRDSGVEISETIRIPEVAFTGDTTSGFFLDEFNEDVLNAKLLIMESTFLDDSTSVEDANKYGHIHLFEVLAHADKFKNKDILFIHFSARYQQEDICKAIENIPAPLQGRVHALTEGF